MQHTNHHISNDRVFFPNLNSIRFLAALVVIIHHVEMAKYWFGLPNIYKDSFVGGVFGVLGIIMFFVLSGFLITYLLLVEYQRTETISVKSFYLRRIMRIWPVYYLIVICSLFIFPNISFFDIPVLSEHVHDNFFAKSLYYLSFLPNVGYTIYPHIPYASQTWSVGVEEQFYLLWPVLMLYAVKRKRVLQVLIGVIVFYLSIKTYVLIDYHSNEASIPALRRWLFWDHFAIDCMAIGGVGAYLLFYQKHKILKVLFNKYLQIALYLTVAVITVKGWTMPWYNNEWYAIIFMVLILNLAANGKSVLNLEFKLLNYLGKISYGLYMYHNLVLTVVLKLIIIYPIVYPGTLAGGIVYHIVALGGTIIVSAISYEYFEKWFLSLKGRYTTVSSGNEVKINAEESGITHVGNASMPIAPEAV